MAGKIVSLLLQVKNAISPGADEAADSLEALEVQARELERELAELEGGAAALEALDGATESAKAAEAAFGDARAEVERLRIGLKVERTPELVVALEKAKIAAADAKKEWSDSRKVVNDLTDTLGRAGVSVDDLSDAEDRLADAIAVAKEQSAEHAKVLDQHRKRYEDLGESVDRSATGIRGWVAGLAGAVAGLAILDKIKSAFVSLVSETVKVGDEFERLAVRLSAKELAWVEDFARNTPLQLAEVANAFAKLKAFGVDPMAGALQQLVDYNAKLGGSYDDLEGMLLAVGQAYSKQKLQQEEVLQLVERGVPAWDLLAKATGRSVPELQNMASAGQLGRKELGLLLDEIGKAASGKAAEAMNTFSGIVSNLTDDVTAFFRRVSDAGAFEYLKQSLRDVQAEITAMAKDGRLQELAEYVSDFFIRIMRDGKSAAQSFGESFGQVVGAAQIIVNSVAAIFNGLKVSIYGTATAIAEAISALANLAGLDGFAAASKSVADGFAAAFAESAKSVQQNIDNIISAADVMPKTFEVVTKEAAAAAEAADKAAESAAGVGEQLKKSAEDAAPPVKSLQERWSDMQSSLVAAGDEAEAAGRKTAEAVAESGSAVQQTSRDVQGLTNDLGAWFRGVRAEMSGLSAEAGVLFDQKLGLDSGPVVSELEAVEQSLAAAREQLGSLARDNLIVFDPTGINTWTNSVLSARSETIIAYGEQKAAFLEYMQALQAGEGVNAGFIKSAEGALSRMSLLGSQDLSTLRSALASAQAQLDQMSSTAESTLVGLLNQLDSLQGNQDAINQRNYEQKRQQIEDALAEAELYANKEAIGYYKEALTALDDLRREQRRQASAAGSSGSSGSGGLLGSSGSSGSSGSGGSTTITLQTSSGVSSVELSGSAASVDALLAVLSEAGLRAG